MRDPLFSNAPAPADDWHLAHCDGGSRGNPGPAGYGAVIQDPHGQTVARLSRFLGRQTNNYAEYSGLVAVLEWALENRIPSLRVVSDSELMVNQMKGRYKVGSPTLRPLWEKARGLATRLDRFDIRHTLRGGNKEADQLANEAMDAGTKAPARDQPKPALSSISAKSAGASLPGIVQGGVVRFLQSTLDEGTFVQVIPEPRNEH
ncbi:MAG TPA: ribonuclease HI family protein [Terracidiphilus sp.]|nr:ribonuclease HI family protein [Terracidiphilus sp.]